MNCFQVLCQFQGVFCFQSTLLSSNGNLLDRECHLVEGIGGRAIQCLRVLGAHTLTNVVTSGRTGRYRVECRRVGARLRSSTETSSYVREVAGVVETMIHAREGGIRLVVECLGAVHTWGARSGIAGAHCEDQSGRTVHWLNASEVICDQVRHCTSDQGDQNGVETSNRTRSGSVGTKTSGRSAAIGVDGWGLHQGLAEENAASSLRNFSWFSSRTAVTALL